MDRAAYDERCIGRLRDMPDGARLLVREIHGCRKTRSRILALGLTPGTEIVVSGAAVNGCRVCVRETCIVLDPESAGNILCAPSPGSAAACAREHQGKK
ncbi:iron transporter [Deltaproteobacteria bacterium]|nr:iron transporter [Deltaproteobacteria bacterium]